MNCFTQKIDTPYEIFPVPQNIVYDGTKLKLSDCIHIVVSTELKEATLPELKHILEEQGFSYSISEERVVGKTNVVLTKGESNHPEGYRLTIKEDIVVEGVDADGIHYGIVTLGMILSQTAMHEVQGCVVTDYPEILYRGYIEGFYGFPWTHEDRMDLMAFGGKYKLNTYIYAPKDDPYHRSHWRELYPADKAQEIAELAKAGHVNNLNFVWTIHPGDTIDLNSEEDFQSAIHKLEQVYGLGVRQFGVLFDDIGGVPNGKEQAEFINRIDSEFIKVKGDIRPLLTVGTRYCEAWGPSMIEYFKPFVDTLHEDIEIMWTGAATMSNISREQFEAPKRTINSNKNLSVWWNYPVNDYCDQKLLMGKIENLSTDVNNINGFFSNPMNQAQASKQALFCIADHNWNTDAFDCDLSFTASFRALAPEVAEDLEIFASNSCYLLDDGGASGTFLFDESWYLKEDVVALKEGLVNKTDVKEVAVRLNSHFVRMEEAVTNIQTKCKNRHLVGELAPFLEATTFMAQAGQSIIQAVEALIVKDLVAMEHKIEDAFEKLQKMDECKVLRLKEGAERYFTVDVGTLVIKPFISEMIELIAIAGGIEGASKHISYIRNNIALSSLGVTATASNSASSAEGPDKVLRGTIAGGKWCATAFRPYLTIDLQEAKTIKHYRIVNCGHPEARESKMWNTKEAQLLASMDGENFTVVDEIVDNKADEIDRILFNEVTARYIRLQIVEPAQISINGGGHTRINAIELYEESYPDQSQKVLTSEIEINESGDVVVHNVKKGDFIALYSSLEDQIPFAVSNEVTEGETEVVFKGLELDMDRLFVERTARNYLPSVRTSKGIVRL